MRKSFAVACVVVTVSAFAALPDDVAAAESSNGGDSRADAPVEASSRATDVMARENVLGDIGGLRRWLGSYGVTIGLTESSEVLGNLRGGLARGAAYDGLTTLTIGVDAQKALAVAGGRFNPLQIHGRDFSPRYLGTRNTASGLEAPHTTRLWEAWYQQSIPQSEIDVRIGQQRLDQEFIVSAYSGTFIDTMFG